MRLPGLLRPLQASGLGCYMQSPACSIFHLPDRLSQLRLNAANTHVEGRRCASVKSQGAYKKKNKKTIPKKLGAKRVGDQYVIPGNIIYKQRGTVWHPGENTILGRDHTIHAAVEGYVKYYRDPSLHPTRQFIGVAFERTDTLPYPKRSVRHRKLGLVATPRRQVEALPWLSPSGIPNTLVRAGDAVKVIASSDAHTAGTATPGSNDEQAADLTLPDRLYHLKKDYSYRESNWQLGRLVGKVGTQIGSTKHWSRKAVFRSRRRKREKELTALKAMAQDQAKAKAAAREKEKAKRLEEAARAAEEQAKREARLAALEALEAEGPVQAKDREISQ